MKNHVYLILFSAACMLPLRSGAQVVADADASSAAEQPALPEGELRLRNGIVLLGTLYQCMAAVQSHESAEASVPQLMRLRDELRQWTSSFNNLPPLTELEALAYEERYLPTIRKINQMIETQADRLAAAEYYSSKNLAAALVHIAQVGH